MTMSRRPGFRVDTRSCTGCKACQLACKDKHDLPAGILWRRVVEVGGGGWTAEGGTWRDGSLTYFVSLSCMHCERPICVEVCPTKAMAKGPEGIVAVDPDRCMGCRYCEWACPYAAPHFDAEKGVMTKCDLCRDRLAEGRPPACVAACQMRVLSVHDFAGDGETGSEGGEDTFPLPPKDLTEPRAALIPHRDVARAAGSDSKIMNEEEI